MNTRPQQKNWTYIYGYKKGIVQEYNSATVQEEKIKRAQEKNTRGQQNRSL